MHYHLGDEAGIPIPPIVLPKPVSEITSKEFYDLRQEWEKKYNIAFSMTTGSRQENLQKIIDLSNAGALFENTRVALDNYSQAQIESILAQGLDIEETIAKTQATARNRTYNKDTGTWTDTDTQTATTTTSKNNTKLFVGLAIAGIAAYFALK